MSRTAWSIPVAVAKRWEALRGSFWFLPAVMVAIAIALALAMIRVDRDSGGRSITDSVLGYGGGAEGATAILQTIATSMVTIAGVVFSLTLVSMSLASSQFGPRLLRNFMRDTVNQVVLGAFIATFLYCVLVLRVVRRAEDALFVPNLSVSVAVLLALASLGALVHFIHHISTSIQTDEITARVTAELLEGIDREFPRDTPEAASRGALPEGFEGDALAVMAGSDGYVQRVNYDEIVDAASSANVVVRLTTCPGKFVIAGTPVAHVAPAERADKATRTRIADAFALGSQRSPAQDVGFSLQQLVEIAVRALSPSTNDPYTAIACIDRIGSAFHRLAPRPAAPVHRDDEAGRLRLLCPGATFAGLLDETIDDLRHHARGHPQVCLRLLATIGQLGPRVAHDSDRANLRRHAGLIAQVARNAAGVSDERVAIRKAYREAIARIG